LGALAAVKAAAPSVLVEYAAGLSCGKHVYDAIAAGIEAVGVASGICLAPNPAAMLEEMARNLREAWDRRQRRQP
jgi:thiazole synthase ThiGH ThiG subunit